MEINFNNINRYSYGNYSKQSSFKGNSSFRTDVVLPDGSEYAEKCNRLSWNDKESLEKEYSDKIKNACFDKNYKLNPQIVDFLDKQKFEFDLPNRGKVNMTIDEYLQDSILRRFNVDKKLYHATSSKEIAKIIKKEGFRPDKIRRMNLGPGFYFAETEGIARDYSNCVLKADCKGKAAQMKDLFFDKISSNSITRDISSFIGLTGNDKYPTGVWNHLIGQDILKEYTRNSLINKFGIDMGYGTGDKFPCFAIYNPESISNVELMDNGNSGIGSYSAWY